MDELLARLPPGARVLDLGAHTGSFATSRSDLSIVRLDREVSGAHASGDWVEGDAAELPFRSGAFDLVISNHSMEHFERLDDVLREVSRIVQPGGALYVAVPDATTLTDRTYRWMGKGGGHINAFGNAQDVASRIARATGLTHRATRLLHSSLSFLNAHNVARRQKKLLLFANGNEDFLALFNWVLRWLDCKFGTRLSVYGWSFYFGDVDLPAKLDAWINVCVRCGSGYAEEYLEEVGAIGKNARGFERYVCPGCGGRNRLTRT